MLCLTMNDIFTSRNVVISARYLFFERELQIIWMMSALELELQRAFLVLAIVSMMGALEDELHLTALLGKKKADLQTKI